MTDTRGRMLKFELHNQLYGLNLCDGFSCESRYLMFGSDCVHEDIIIGVTAGVGGAILIALLVATIMMTLKSRHRKTNKDV